MLKLAFFKNIELFKFVKGKRLWLLSLMSVLLILSGVMNVLLNRKVLSLRSSLESLGKLGVGHSIQPIVAHGLDGSPAKIEFSNSKLPTVLYVFSPECVWCTRNQENFKAVVSALNGEYRIIGLSLSEASLESYVADNGFSFPVYKNIDESSKESLRLGTTPHTLVISPDNKVMKNWKGAYVGSQKEDVEQFFRIQLPGIKIDK